jgi:hypothetical protein
MVVLMVLVRVHFYDPADVARTRDARGEDEAGIITRQ